MTKSTGTEKPKSSGRGMQSLASQLQSRTADLAQASLADVNPGLTRAASPPAQTTKEDTHAGPSQTEPSPSTLAAR